MINDIYEENRRNVLLTSHKPSAHDFMYIYSTFIHDPTHASICIYIYIHIFPAK